MRPRRVILIVSDDEPWAQCIRMALETRLWVRCLHPEMTLDAIRLLRRGAADAILLLGVSAATDAVRAALPNSDRAILVARKHERTTAAAFAGSVLPWEERDPNSMARILERLRLLLIRKRGPKRAVPPSPPSSSATTAA